VILFAATLDKKSGSRNHDQDITDDVKTTLPGNAMDRTKTRYIYYDGKLTYLTYKYSLSYIYIAVGFIGSVNRPDNPST